MKHTLTAVFITARPDPKLQWFLDSLSRQLYEGERVSVIVVHADWLEVPPFSIPHNLTVGTSPCRPTVWQGKHRLTTTEQQWWSVSCYKNTGACLCRTDWVAFCDDRSVLLDGWMQAIREAMDGGYAVAGTYSKHSDVVVENGVVISSSPFANNSGIDGRVAQAKKSGWSNPCDCPGEWMYGCTFALPLEWYLRVGGHDETCDGLSMEDVIFGLMLTNCGFPIKYDTRMAILEDRTAGQLGTAIKREDKGVSPQDKSHALLAMLKDRKTAMHGFDIRQVRRDVLAGKGWPKPWGPFVDFYDGQKIEDMK